MDNAPKLRPWGFYGIVASCVFLAIFGFVRWSTIKNLDELPWIVVADVFETLVQSLGFIWIVIGYFQNSEAIKLQSAELQAQSRELNLQVKEMTMQSKEMARASKAHEEIAAFNHQILKRQDDELQRRDRLRCMISDTAIHYLSSTIMFNVQKGGAPLQLEFQNYTDQPHLATIRLLYSGLTFNDFSSGTSTDEYSNFFGQVPNVEAVQYRVWRRRLQPNGNRMMLRLLIKQTNEQNAAMLVEVDGRVHIELIWNTPLSMFLPSHLLIDGIQMVGYS